MNLNLLIGNVMRICSIPKLLYYKLRWVKVDLFSWTIFFWWPKIRWWVLIKIGKNFQLWRYSRLQWKIKIWDNVFLNEFASVNATNDNKWEIIFKDNIMCGPWVFLQSWDHAFRKWEIYKNAEWWKSWPIIIGNNVWIWARTIILKWVTIWNNSVIWAGSVVTKSIPNSVIAAWNPCKVIKKIK